VKYFRRPSTSRFATLNISNDIIIYGKTQADHEIALKTIFKNFVDVNLTSNMSLINPALLSLVLFSLTNVLLQTLLSESQSTVPSLQPQQVV